MGTRFSAGRVSSSTKKVIATPSTPTSATRSKITRQLDSAITTEPNSGARIGAALNTSMMSDISFAASAPV